MKDFKYTRELKVGILAAVCLFLLFFGFNFLKGVNIFSSTYSFQGRFTRANGLEEQAAVYIRGYKVGQVDRIRYDFTRDSAFTVEISIHHDIDLPKGTEMVLIQDGLLGGGAIELRLPTNTQGEPLASGTMLPTAIEEGLMDRVQHQLLASLETTVGDADSLIRVVNTQLADNHLYNALANVDRVSNDLTAVSADAKRIVRTDVPRVIGSAESTINGLQASVRDVNGFTRQLDRVDLPATIARVEQAVDTVTAAVGQVGGLVSDIRSENGTLGSLIYSRTLYNDLDSTVVSADSLLRDLKANPKRYVHFSLFDCSGSKKKKK